MENFFTEVLGAKLVEHRKFGAADGAVLNLGGVKVNLRTQREGDVIVGDGSSQRFGLDHLGLEVDDLDSAYKDLTGKGYRFTIPPQKSAAAKTAFFNGPDNIIIELIQPLH
jgi:catechol 2,3-dioxygenase-like lactoylglutathione lyase family enzyme